jgi:heterodisulfide reductase subunit A
MTAKKSAGTDGGVLVIGAGIAGATVAHRLATAGHHVHLVEREAEIGGHARETGCKATDVCMRCNACVADDVFRSVGGVAGIEIHTATQVAALAPGRNGCRFMARLSNGGSECEIGVDAVVVATGHQPCQPAENPAYSYGRIANVITGKEAELQLAGQHCITRPSDGQPPKRIAFVQCVGSRTEEIHRRPDDTDYCSTVCCSYALRMARRLRHDVHGAAITVFYMDIQNFGKGFNAFLAACRSDMTFIRSRPYELREGEDGRVQVIYTPEGPAHKGPGCVAHAEFDLVILAVGIRPRPDARELADRLGIAVDDQGFFGLKGAGCIPDLQREGLFVVGTCESPKDIAGCITQAEAVTARILESVSARTGRR